MSERLFLSPPVAHSLALLSRAWLTAMRTCTLYSSTHPVVAGAAARFAAALDAAMGLVPGFAVAVTPTQLLVDGQAAGDEVPAGDRAAIETLATALHSRGVLEIAFHAPVPREVLLRLLEVLGGEAREETPGANVATAWDKQGHPSIGINAVDYGCLLETHDASASASRDELWRSIVAAVQSGRRSFDEREQQRLLGLAGNPTELAALAETVTAAQCTPDGSPLVLTQASTVVACFRHLASIASVVAPERLPHVVHNLIQALLRLDPHVAMEALSSDRERAAEAQGAPSLAHGLDEDALARLLARVVITEGGASPRVAELFQLLLPDDEARHRVLDGARSIAAREPGPGASSDEFWESVGELLGAYKDQQFASEQYRAVLDGSPEAAPAAVRPFPEIDACLEAFDEAAMRAASIDLLADLVRLEPATDRAVVVLNHLAQLADESLLAGAFDEAARSLATVAAAVSRDALASAVAQVLSRVGTGTALVEVTDTLGDLQQDDWRALERCYLAIGAGCVPVLARAATSEPDSRAVERAGAVLLALGAAAVEPLVALLPGALPAARLRIIGWLGRIASPAAVPALQAALRSSDGRLLDAVVSALASIADPAAARAIYVALQGASEGKRRAIVNAMVQAGDRRATPMLARVLQDCQVLKADFDLALDTLEALGRLGDARAVSAITRVMRLHSWRYRRRLRTLKRACVRALSAIADPSAQGALHDAAHEGDRMLRRIISTDSPATAGAA